MRAVRAIHTRPTEAVRCCAIVQLYDHRSHAVAAIQTDPPCVASAPCTESCTASCATWFVVVGFLSGLSVMQGLHRWGVVAYLHAVHTASSYVPVGPVKHAHSDLQATQERQNRAGQGRAGQGGVGVGRGGD